MATGRESSGCRWRRHSAASSSNKLGCVVVTHPFLLLSGQRLENLYLKHRAGDTVVVCSGGASGQIAAPKAWTDRGDPLRRHRLSAEGLAAAQCPDTRDPGLLSVVPGGDTLLCDDWTKERPVGSVHADVAGRGGVGWCPAGRRGAAVGRVTGGTDPAVRQGWLPLRRGPTARPPYVNFAPKTVGRGSCATCPRRCWRWCVTAWTPVWRCRGAGRGFGDQRSCWAGRN